MTWLPSDKTLTSLLAVGAPRYQHVGRVLLFQELKGRGHWSQVQKIDGIQVSVALGDQGHMGHWSCSLPSASRPCAKHC